jgi:hypothetical protein
VAPWLLRNLSNKQEQPIPEQRELTPSTAVLESSQYLSSSDMTIIRPNQTLAMNLELEVPRVLIMVHYPIPQRSVPSKKFKSNISSSLTVSRRPHEGTSYIPAS